MLCYVYCNTFTCTCCLLIGASADALCGLSCSACTGSAILARSPEVVGSLLAAVAGEVWLRGAKALHPGIGCDGENCGANPIEGVRFSKRGQDWDLCTACYGRCCSTEAEQARYERLERACDRGLISAQVAAARLLSKLMPHLQNLHPPHDGQGGECRVQLDAFKEFVATHRPAYSAHSEALRGVLDGDTEMAVSRGGVQPKPAAATHKRSAPD